MENFETSFQKVVDIVNCPKLIKPKVSKPHQLNVLDKQKNRQFYWLEERLLQWFIQFVQNNKDSILYYNNYNLTIMADRHTFLKVNISSLLISDNFDFSYRTKLFTYIFNKRLHSNVLILAESEHILVKNIRPTFYDSCNCVFVINTSIWAQVTPPPQKKTGPPLLEDLVNMIWFCLFDFILFNSWFYFSIGFRIRFH